MKRTERCRQFENTHHLTAHGGFTLVEVLVVMAIMIILFGMLFVPISSSVDMASEGQRRVQMQQQLQMATERVNRELSEATGIYLPEYIPLAGASPTTADDEYLINYSNITFQPPGPSDQPAVRYAVMTQEYDFVLIDGFWYCIPTPPDLDNPFILYRMEGMMDDTIFPDRNVFGAWYDEDGDGSSDYFVIGYWSSRNALTPARGADIPVTRTVCLDADGYLVQPLDTTYVWAEGYVKAEDITEVFGSGEKLVYLHDGIKFGPLRVANERLAGPNSGDTTTFAARYGNWLGLQNTEDYSVGQLTWGVPILINSSELRPRIVVRRDGYDGDAGEGLLDTDGLDPYDPGSQPAIALAPDGLTVIDNMFGISWNSQQGTVTVATAAGPAYIGFDADPATPLPDMPVPAPGPHSIWDFGVYDAGLATITRLDPAYLELITAQTTLNGASAGTSLPVVSTSGFQSGDKVCVSQASGGEPDPAGNSEIRTVQSVAPNTITLTLPLTYAYVAGDIVQAVVPHDGSDPTMRKAYCSYGLAPLIEAGIADKMVVPDSMRVWVTATNSLGASCSKEYRRITFGNPLNPKQENIGPGQFAIQPTGTLTGVPDEDDYSQATILFGNGELGDDMRRTPPPSPDEPSTFGGTSTGWDVGDLTAFGIEISYKVRRNFSTSSPTLQNDEIEVSYSTRAVYDVSLELRPWRDYEDNDTNGIWQPWQTAKGVHLQVHIPIRNIQR